MWVPQCKNPASSAALSGVIRTDASNREVAFLLNPVNHERYLVSRGDPVVDPVVDVALLLGVQNEALRSNSDHSAKDVGTVRCLVAIKHKRRFG